MTDVRTLLLLRHAKADPDADEGDHERALTARGRRDGHAVGIRLAAQGLVPDLVLCSDALRATETWEAAREALPDRVDARVEPRLYQASPASVVNLVAETAERVRTLLVVGHEPAMSATALALAGPGSDPALLAAVRAHLPTAGVVVLEMDGGWGDVRAEGCRLVALEGPTGRRGVKG